MRRAISRVGQPEPAPAGIAGFRENQVPAEGTRRAIVHDRFERCTHGIRTGMPWILQVPSPLGTNFAGYTGTPVDVSEANPGRRYANEHSSGVPVRLTGWDERTFRPVALPIMWVAEGPRRESPKPKRKEVVPPASQAWMAAPAAPVMREVRTSGAAEPFWPAFRPSVAQQTMELAGTALPGWRMPALLALEAETSPAVLVARTSAIRPESRPARLPDLELAEDEVSMPALREHAMQHAAPAEPTARPAQDIQPITAEPRPPHLPELARLAGAVLPDSRMRPALPALEAETSPAVLVARTSAIRPESRPMRMPDLDLAEDEVSVPALREHAIPFAAAAGPVARPAEVILPITPESRPMRMPDLKLAADEVSVPALREHAIPFAKAAVPVACSAEDVLPITLESRRPHLQGLVAPAAVAPFAFPVPPPSERAMASLHAEPALREVQPVGAATSPMAVGLHRPADPPYVLEIAETELLEAIPVPPPCDEYMPGLPAQAAERARRPAAAEAALEPIALALPRLVAFNGGTLSLAAETDLVQPPPAAPVERSLEPRWDPTAAAVLDVPPVAMSLPAMPRLQPAMDPHVALPPYPAASPVFAAQAAIPLDGQSKDRAPALPAPGNLVPAANCLPAGSPAAYVPRAVECGAVSAPYRETCSPAAPPLQAPWFAGLLATEMPESSWRAPLAPRPVESLPRVEALAPAPAAAAPHVLLPELRLPENREFSIAAFGDQPALAAEPEPGAPSKKVAVLRPMGSIRLAPPKTEARWPHANIPQPGLIPVEFHCQRSPSRLSRRLVWKTPEVALVPPGFRFTLAADRPEEMLAPKPEPRASIAEVLTMPQAAKPRRSNPTMIRVAQIAACLVAAAGLWYAGNAIVDEQTVASVNRALSGTEPSPSPSTSMAAPVTAEARPEAPPVAEAPATGPVARVRQAIANRAAAEVTDTMRTGMDSWGAPAKSWAPGWSRHPDGYTRTGELALFSPSMTYANYRLEFFGQIENKGMGWVVRAQDKQNYYAMKFKVVEDGLRPVIAMVHYPVVKGRKGHTVETTLSTMVHRNMPFRVSVDVHGSRLTAAIEGQQVDSWTDDLLASGGVGFFSEVGERARLYWMKVSKNQDWLGLVCSFIAGGDSAQKAELRRPGIPAGVPQPAAPEYAPDVVLAEAETSHGFTGGPQRARIWIRGRIRPWSC